MFLRTRCSLDTIQTGVWGKGGGGNCTLLYTVQSTNGVVNIFAILSQKETRWVNAQVGGEQIGVAPQ